MPGRPCAYKGCTAILYPAWEGDYCRLHHCPRCKEPRKHPKAHQCPDEK
jgi:hypothetical protein